jgi:four helix bundle protein
MKYKRFEELPVWQAAIELALGIFSLTAKLIFRRYRGLRDQIDRAGVSISNNIAEGFERGTTNELLAFLYIARGSAGEVRSMLCLLELMPDFADLKSEISDLKFLAEDVSKQLRGWANSLQNSEIKGQRYLTDRTRHSAQASKEREEFLAELRRVQDEHLAKIQKGREA